MAFDIKPLEWQESAGGLSATTTLGILDVFEMRGGTWSFSCPNGFYERTGVDRFGTQAEAKISAELYYRSRIMEALVEVKQ